MIAFPEVETPLFTAEELLQAADKLPSGKAPGPDCVPNEVIRLAARRSPDTFLIAFNACLVQRVFPIKWKRAKLILLHKGAGKPPDQPSSYRPIILLDGAGKLLERMLLDRLRRGDRRPQRLPIRLQALQVYRGSHPGSAEDSARSGRRSGAEQAPVRCGDVRRQKRV